MRLIDWIRWGAGPVVAPVHARTERRVEHQTRRHPGRGFEVGVDVEGRREVVIGLEMALRRTRVVGQRGVGGLRGDARDTGREVEELVLECGGGGVEPQRFGVEFHGRAHVGHTVLFRGEVVYLIPLRTGRHDCGCGREKEDDFLHVRSVWFALGASVRRREIAAKVEKQSPTPKYCGRKFRKTILNDLLLSDLSGRALRSRWRVGWSARGRSRLGAGA